MIRALDALVPPAWGRGLRWLLASSWTSNLGDGICLAAGPLLVASRTDDPFLVSLAVLLQQLPWLVFGLHAGALADRVDRRLVVVVVDLVRAGVLGVLALSLATETVSIAVVLAALFLLGTAEVFADTASATLLPMLVGREDLALANARLQTGFVTMNQLAGPPLGALLFVVGVAVPFAAQALLVGLGALLVSRVVLPVAPASQRRPVRTEIAEGCRWVLHHAAVRTLVLTIFIFNITYGAAWSVLVLYARDRLGLTEVGYGLIVTVMAGGGLLGALGYGALTRRVSLGAIMRVGLVIETLTHLALALTTTPAVAFVVFAVFGVHAFAWGATSTAVRQRMVPRELQGRVGSVHSLGSYGGLVAGAAFGGVLAQAYGVTAPFWFAFAGSAVFLVVLWRQLAHIAHVDDAGSRSGAQAGRVGG